MSAHMGPGKRYVETLDQAALTAIFDLKLARRASSFDKLYREIVSFLEALEQAR